MGFFDQHRQPAQQGQQRRPTSEDVAREIEDIRSNTNRYIQQAGVDIPQEMQNDPRAMCLHLINSGQVDQSRLRFAQPLIHQLMGRR